MSQANAWQPKNALEGARYVQSLGMRATPVDGKAATLRDWRNRQLSEDELDTYIRGPINAGVVLGEPSGRLADADLDCQEAVLAAPDYLSSTMVWGRASKPRSHYAFRLTSSDGAAEVKYQDPAPPTGMKAMLCELRYTGQTVIPGSVNTQDGHPEPVRYEDGLIGPPVTIDYLELKAALGKVAAAALIARRWVDGRRHALSLPLAGVLCNGGMSREQAMKFVGLICRIAGETQEDTANRLNSVTDTYDRAEQHIPYTAGPTLEEELGTPVINKLREWLELKRQGSTGHLLGPDDLPLAHDGDGDRFAARWAGTAIYCAAEKRWYIYNGCYWERDRTQKINEMAKEVAGDFRHLVMDTFANNPARFGQQGYGTQAQCMEWARQMGNVRHVDDMLKAASSRPQIAVAPEQLDSNKTFFNVLNCTVELDTKTGNISVHNHRPQDYITMIAPVRYNPGATHPLFNQEFRELFFPEDERWLFFQEVAAEAITGLPKRHSLNLIGPTNAGKSMSLTLVSRVMGDYAATLEYTSLIRNQRSGGDTPRGDLWRVRKKRLLAISEVPPDAKLDVALYKALLGGGDKMAIRNLYDATGGEDIEWGASLWMSGNKPYGPPPGETAAFERLLPLVCEHQVPEDKRDQNRQLETLDIRLTGDAVFAWILEGFRRLYGEKHGRIKSPDFIERAKAELQDKLDPWSEIVNELVVFTGNANDAVLKQELWEHAVSKRLDETGEMRLQRPFKERQAFNESVARNNRAREMRSDGRFGGRPCWQYARWSDWALENLRVTLPDW